jgi:hypothetical protein
LRQPVRGQEQCGHDNYTRDQNQTLYHSARKAFPLGATGETIQPRLYVIEWCPEREIERHTAEAQGWGHQQDNF